MINLQDYIQKKYAQRISTMQDTVLNMQHLQENNRKSSEELQRLIGEDEKYTREIEQLKAELVYTTAHSHQESIAALSLQSEQSTLELEECTTKLSRLLDENTQFERLLKDAEETLKSLSKQRKKQVKQYQHTANQIKEIASFIDELSDRVLNAPDQLSALSNTLRQPMNQRDEVTPPSKEKMPETPSDRVSAYFQKLEAHYQKSAYGTKSPTFYGTNADVRLAIKRLTYK